MKMQPSWDVISAWWGSEQRIQPLCLDFWSIELWDNKWVYEKFVVICFVATEDENNMNLWFKWGDKGKHVKEWKIKDKLEFIVNWYSLGHKFHILFWKGQNERRGGQMGSSWMECSRGLPSLQGRRKGRSALGEGGTGAWELCASV